MDELRNFDSNIQDGMCRILKILKSSCHAWRAQLTSARAQANGKTENEMDSGAMRLAYATRRSTRDNVRKVIDTLLAEPLLQA
ncbi:MAG TPA: hypothetical protein PLI90_12245 [Rhodocyclaceae bacterium]|nr:hypothetical protein [Rhodocyclaceae bacterium]